MSESNMEALYRDMVLAELRELNTSQKDSNKLIGELLDRMKEIEVVVLGSKVGEKTGILHRIATLETDVTELKKLKIQLITAFTVIQTILGVILTLALKLSWF